MTARDAQPNPSPNASPIPTPIPTPTPLNTQQALEVVSHHWDAEIVPQLVEYIRVPAKSPGFDADWAQHGYLDAVVEQARHWVAAQQVPGLTLEVVRLEGRTPVLFFDIPATGNLKGENTVLFYGHLDKQPEMTGWRPGLGPWTPVYEDGKLYGRGSADDGYAVFAALSAIMAVDQQGVARPRCVGLIETCEESGSYDLPVYLDALAPRIGNVQLVIALDSGAGNYDQMWVTTSLRGLVNGILRVDVLTEGVHSGDAGGAVPSSFRVARQLLDRIDDSRTGVVKPAAFNCEIPAERVAQARQAADILGESMWRRFPWAACCDGPQIFVQPTTKDPVELILNRTWRAAMAVTGADGLPPLETAGNVQRPYTSLKLSLRLPPLVDGPEAAAALKETLETDPPHSAGVRFTCQSAATGWNAPPTAPWLSALLDAASQTFYDKPAAYMGEGGTIPFMGMLGQKFPQAQMLVTGVLGPKSNAHGPNEFLHVPYAKRLTAAVAVVLAGATGVMTGDASAQILLPSG
ncbi:MAG: M20 family metallopeptidase [Betaproteobacteria bacterium]|nr:M20 family metallopeptidase [Betaproteobacteria bacterium]